MTLPFQWKITFVHTKWEEILKTLYFTIVPNKCCLYFHIPRPRVINGGGPGLDLDLIKYQSLHYQPPTVNHLEPEITTTEKFSAFCKLPNNLGMYNSVTTEFKRPNYYYNTAFIIPLHLQKNHFWNDLVAIFGRSLWSSDLHTGFQSVAILSLSTFFGSSCLWSGFPISKTQVL